MGKLNFDPEVLKSLLFGNGGPAAMFGADPTAAPPQQDPAAPAPQASDATPPPPSQVGAPPRGAIADSMPPAAPKFEDPNDYAAAHPEAVQANMQPRPVGDFDTGKHAGLRRALATMFGGIAEFGGDLNHNPGAGSAMFKRWSDQDEAQRAYDAGLPKMKAGAVSEAFKEHLGQAGQQANIAHTQQETANLQQNLPLQEQAEKHYKDLEDA